MGYIQRLLSVFFQRPSYSIQDENPESSKRVCSFFVTSQDVAAHIIHVVYGTGNIDSLRHNHILITVYPD